MIKKLVINFTLFILIIIHIQCSSNIHQIKEKPIHPKDEICFDTVGPLFRISARCKEQYKGMYIWNKGTGFAIKYKDTPVIITAYHVLEDVDEIIFQTESGKRVLIKTNKIVNIPRFDTSIIFYSDCSASVRTLEMDTLRIDDKITVIGFPGLSSKTISVGHVQNIRLATSAIVKHGMSGGPVIKNGRAVGLISSLNEHTDALKNKLYSNIFRLSDIFEVYEKNKK